MKRFLALFLAALVALVALAPGAPAAAQGARSDWRTTDLVAPVGSALCFDPAAPGVVILPQPGGTVAFDWRDGGRWQLNSRQAGLCAPDGTLYAQEPAGGAWRFNLADPQGRPIERMPTHAAEDGTPRLYSFLGGELWASEDRGESWQLRSRLTAAPPGVVPIRGVTQLLPDAANSRLLYALRVEEIRGTRAQQINYTVMASPDGGATWEDRHSGGTSFCVNPAARLWRAPGARLPFESVGLDVGCSGNANVLFSRDGGRSFTLVGIREGGGAVYVVSTAAGLLRFWSGKPFARSSDGGVTWRDLSEPPPLGSLSGESPLEVAPALPGNVFAQQADGTVWRSSDSGASWRRIEGRVGRVFVSPHNPPALLSIYADGPDNARLLLYDLAAPPDQRCFAETGYCISGRIGEFWAQNGGLPVFGLPITPPREELIEGKPVLVQWFERNRLELHPENAPPYDVLLGRLGADRLAQQGRDWQQFPRTGEQPGCRFFAETGQSVCGRVLAGWRTSGLELDGRPGKSEAESMALFGLPLSPLQNEQLSDGRSYQVQWFERARFELHPENAPPYDLLLGLLGSEVLTSNTSGLSSRCCTPTPEKGR